MKVKIDGKIVECNSCEIMQDPVIHVGQYAPNDTQGRVYEREQISLPIYEVVIPALSSFCSAYPIVSEKRSVVIYNGLTYPVELYDKRWILNLPGENALDSFMDKKGSKWLCLQQLMQVTDILER